jgi:hypothetical protein
MTTVQIEGDCLRVLLEGWDRVWALKQELEIPLAHVRGVERAAAGLRPRGLRAPGSYWPGRIAAGTYRRRTGKEFWSVRDTSNAVVVHLDDDAFDRLVLQVPDPAETIAQIQRAIGGPQRASA